MVFRPKAPGNRCLYTDQRGLIERLKKNFGWSNFQACYPLEACPQKRDAIPGKLVNSSMLLIVATIVWGLIYDCRPGSRSRPRARAS